jgi:hypothetical protein
MDRRSFLQTAPAAAIAMAVPVVIKEAKKHDPLFEAIAYYRDGMREFNALDDQAIEDDVNSDRLIFSRLKVIEEWKNPATSFAGAIAALRVAKEETTFFEATPAVRPLIEAALGYFENMGGLGE